MCNPLQNKGTCPICGYDCEGLIRKHGDYRPLLHPPIFVMRKGEWQQIEYATFTIETEIPREFAEFMTWEYPPIIEPIPPKRRATIATKNGSELLPYGRIKIDESGLFYEFWYRLVSSTPEKDGGYSYILEWGSL